MLTLLVEAAQRNLTDTAEQTSNSSRIDPTLILVSLEGSD